MKAQDKQDLIKILMGNNSVKLSFNVPVENNYSNVHEILIHQCNAATIQELVKNNYSCFLTEKGLSIDKF